MEVLQNGKESWTDPLAGLLLVVNTLCYSFKSLPHRTHFLNFLSQSSFSNGVFSTIHELYFNSFSLCCFKEEKH